MTLSFASLPVIPGWGYDARGFDVELGMCRDWLMNKTGPRYNWKVSLQGRAWRACVHSRQAVRDEIMKASIRMWCCAPESLRRFAMLKNSRKRCDSFCFGVYFRWSSDRYCTYRSEKSGSLGHRDFEIESIVTGIRKRTEAHFTMNALLKDYSEWVRNHRNRMEGSTGCKNHRIIKSER